jgi:pSer/pThr/pTyr-binding forkhead associated (FHA) protein
MVICPQCHTELPNGFRFCGNCGSQIPDKEGGGEATARTMFFGGMQAPNRAKLTLIRGEGVEGVTYHLNGTEHLAGRSEGEILFPDDPFLSPLHACFYYQDNQLMARDEGSANGLFIRIRKPMALNAGSRFLVGEQLIQFEPTTEDDVPLQPDDQGTYFYTSPRRPSRFKLIQLLRGGDIGMIFRAPAEDVYLGRDANDINFPEDPYISGQHAKVSATPEGYYLTDLGSKNGTFLQIDEPFVVSHGDYVFLGQQLMRVEIT